MCVLGHGCITKLLQHITNTRKVFFPPKHYRTSCVRFVSSLSVPAYHFPVLKSAKEYLLFAGTVKLISWRRDAHAIVHNSIRVCQPIVSVRMRECYEHFFHEKGWLYWHEIWLTKWQTMDSSRMWRQCQGSMWKLTQRTCIPELHICCDLKDLLMGNCLQVRIGGSEEDLLIILNKNIVYSWWQSCCFVPWKYCDKTDAEMRIREIKLKESFWIKQKITHDKYSIVGHSWILRVTWLIIRNIQNSNE